MVAWVAENPNRPPLAASASAGFTGFPRGRAPPGCGCPPTRKPTANRRGLQSVREIGASRYHAPGRRSHSAWPRRSRHILAETDHVAVDVAHVEFLHAVGFELRSVDQVGVPGLELHMDVVGALDPDISVEGFTLPDRVRAAVRVLHQRQHDGNFLSPDDHEYRRIEKVRTDLEAELVAVVLRRPHHVLHEKQRRNPFRLGWHLLASPD